MPLRRRRCTSSAPNVIERVATTEHPSRCWRWSRQTARGRCLADGRLRDGGRSHRRSGQRRHDHPLGRGGRRRRPSCSPPVRSTRSTRRWCGRRRARCSASPWSSCELDRAAGRRAAGARPRRRTTARPTPRPTSPGRVALVVGNEAHGVPDDAPVDGWVTIPHAGRGREPERRHGRHGPRIRSRPPTAARGSVSRYGRTAAAISVPPGVPGLRVDALTRRARHVARGTTAPMSSDQWR